MKFHLISVINLVISVILIARAGWIADSAPLQSLINIAVAIYCVAFVSLMERRS
ncbi:hypothetical protein APY04_0788 [Hyphomicrobium sulfonivorans]|uniref:Uncharacterized protein n=1 Tax=Hyphomicrobium sulfonivorans TaxID=121290 RepID=A0A109BMK7_HYPSL|nr:hypothetical protein APY04_0788 [Hyphomicrobium sulfonivorans]